MNALKPFEREMLRQVFYVQLPHIHTVYMREQAPTNKLNRPLVDLRSQHLRSSGANVIQNHPRP